MIVLGGVLTITLSSFQKIEMHFYLHSEDINTHTTSRMTEQQQKIAELHQACYDGNQYLVEELIHDQDGEDLNALQYQLWSETGDNVLHTVLKGDRVNGDIAILVLETIMSTSLEHLVLQKNKEGLTPFDVACRMNKIWLAKYLANYFDPWEIEHDDNLEYAKLLGHQEIVEYLTHAKTIKEEDQ